MVQKTQGSTIPKHDYEVKGVKSFTGHEGYGFNATLYRKGKKVARVDDMASGGEMDYRWLDNDYVIIDFEGYDGREFHRKGTKEEKLFLNFIKSIPPQESDFAEIDSFKWNGDCFVSHLVGEYESRQKIKKWCRTKTVFQTTDCKEGEYRTLNCKYDERARQHIMTKYPDAVIMNERI